MKDKPHVSIITPTYNHGMYIAQCIESVLDQSYPHWEQIIIDDGSTDETGEIASSYRDNRIRYLRHEHRGIWELGRAYNEALQMSRGKLIAVLEGDDFWPPYKLERQLSAFEKRETILSWGKAANTDYQGKVIQVGPDHIQRFAGLSRQEVFKRLLLDNPIHSCTVICRKEALQSIGGFKQPSRVPYVDGPTWLELSLSGEFQPVDEILGFYRHHDRQVSSAMKREMIEARKWVIEFLMRLPPEARASLGRDGEDMPAKLQQRLDDSYYYLGRADLAEGKWREARRDFAIAIRRGKLSTKLKAGLGLACSWCKRDLEGLADWSEKLS